MGETLNSPKGVTSGVPVAPVSIYPKQLENSHMSQLVNKTLTYSMTQRCQICEQGLCDDHKIS